MNYVHSGNWIDLPQLELSNAEFKQQDELYSFVFGGKEWCLDVKNVESLELIGLKGIERMIIGDGSFTKHKEGFGYDANYHFCVKGSGSASEVVGDGLMSELKGNDSIRELKGNDSTRELKSNDSTRELKDNNATHELKNNNAIRELRIGRYSFSDCASCEIENCAFTSIAIGNLTEQSYNFYYATLQLSRTQSIAL